MPAPLELQQAVGESGAPGPGSLSTLCHRGLSTWACGMDRVALSVMPGVGIPWGGFTGSRNEASGTH